jgi:fatty acid synthase, animal type
LTKDGFCRPFDKNASGFSRSEAVCVVFLQKSADAKRVYANVVYTKTNNDGFKNEGISFPSNETQKQLFKEFYEDLGINPNAVGFVEAHATGTVIGDPQECKSFDSVFSKGRDKPLLVGSIKSNIGHTEAAAGVCSIAKIIIAFENKMIPPNINFTEPRFDIPALVSGRLKVVTESEKLPNSLIAMNSFGLGGSNAHALFQAHDKEKINFGIPADNLPRLVVWSGRSEKAVESVLGSVTKQQLDAEFVALLQNTQRISVSANTYKGYGIFTQTGTENAKCIGQHIQHFEGAKRPIVWVYSGEINF